MFWEVGLRTSNPFPRIGASVQVDWLGALTEPQLNIFRSFEKEAESLYSMFSISLDEAISERNKGCKKQYIRLVELSSALCGPFAECLDSLLCCMAAQSKACGATPSFAPLCTEYFCGTPAKRAALRCRLLYRLPGLRQRKFLRKIDVLREIAASSNVEFHRAAFSLVLGSVTLTPACSWSKVIACHYDLNTCLSESLVMLKCFLRILSADQVGFFRVRLFGHDGSTRPLIKLPARVHFLTGR
jgi:hypothetical protein